MTLTVKLWQRRNLILDTRWPFLVYSLQQTIYLWNAVIKALADCYLQCTLLEYKYSSSSMSLLTACSSVLVTLSNYTKCHHHTFRGSYFTECIQVFRYNKTNWKVKCLRKNCNNDVVEIAFMDFSLTFKRFINFDVVADF